MSRVKCTVGIVLGPAPIASTISVPRLSIGKYSRSTRRSRSFGLGVVQLTLILSMALAMGCASTPTDKSEISSAVKAEDAILNGDAALNRQDIDGALIHYVQAVTAIPTYEGFYKIAVIHSMQGNWAIAEKSYRKALEFKNDLPPALEGLGLVLLRQGNHAEAEEYLSRAIKASPDSWRAYNALGVISDLHRHHETAQQHYFKALEVKASLPMLLNNIGYSKYLHGDFVTARRYFKRSLSSDPNNKKAWSNIGLLHVRQGDYIEAANAFQKIMDNHEALNKVGYLCMLDGKHQLAKQYFLKSIRSSPSYYEKGYDNLAQVKRFLNRTRD